MRILRLGNISNATASFPKTELCLRGKEMDLKILKEAIRKEVRQYLREADVFADDAEQPDQAAAAAPEQGQQAPAPDNKVSLGKVSGTPESGAAGTAEEITLENVVEKLNSIRSGKSFKDDQVMAQMEKYYGDLKDAEKKALQAFLTGISQIVVAGVSGEQAPEPKDAPSNIQMTDKKDIQSKSVKPNVIKKAGSAGGSSTGSSKPSGEDTSGPISVKQR